ncbi:hypothetical protein BDA99DRAFT_531730 [Phascolomyces articulosus]|uniref:PHD-type domain-containing protein n=1 Tax=Phascolomyces articulosus TaxID=60185 RepID=A0AAD5PJQ8_9FUNG|nr:hypothetical protein BDA99DRAFT_531730 [Phascolomyces articulosus]
MNTTSSRSSTTKPFSVDNHHHTLLNNNNTTTTSLLTSTDPTLALSTTLGITDPYLAKPKVASADMRHEYGNALLPITTTTTSPHLGIVESYSTIAAWQLLLYYQQQLCPPLVKDDVFLGPADNESVITVNSSTDSTMSSSLSTSSSFTTTTNTNNNNNNNNTTTTCTTNTNSNSTPSSIGNWAPTPCLSPVTSPSDFLCNHEPLFDGIEDLQQQKVLSKEDNLNDKNDNEHKNALENDDLYKNGIVEQQNGYATQVQKPDSLLAASPNLDWYELTKEDNATSPGGHTSSVLAAGLPTPSPTASENEASLFGDDTDEEEDEEDDPNHSVNNEFNDHTNYQHHEFKLLNQHLQQDEPQIPFGFFSSDEEDDEDDDDDIMDSTSFETSYYAATTMSTAPVVAPLRLPPPVKKTATRSLKRKRSQSIDSITSCESEQEEEENDAPVLQRLHRLRLTEPKRTKTTTTTTTTTTTKGKPVTKRRTKRHPGRGRTVRPKTIACPAYDIQQQQKDEQDGIQRTIFERLTHAGIDWCRYCGTTEGVNWRPGPWGKRTLCNKHGCDYKGYGIASRLPRLDLSAFIHERLEDRRRPVVQQYCVVCQGPESNEDNKLVPCEGGCSRAYHQLCRIPAITSYQDQQWCCSTVCRDNRKRNKVGPYDS